LAFRELLMHADVSKAVTESIRMGTALWESEWKVPVCMWQEHDETVSCACVLL
jgi:hypothetical protein